MATTSRFSRNGGPAGVPRVPSGCTKTTAGVGWRATATLSVSRGRWRWPTPAGSAGPTGQRRWPQLARRSPAQAVRVGRRAAQDHPSDRDLTFDQRARAPTSTIDHPQRDDRLAPRPQTLALRSTTRVRRRRARSRRSRSQSDRRHMGDGLLGHGADALTRSERPPAVRPPARSRRAHTLMRPERRPLPTSSLDSAGENRSPAAPPPTPSYPLAAPPVPHPQPNSQRSPPNTPRTLDTPTGLNHQHPGCSIQTEPASPSFPPESSPAPTPTQIASCSASLDRCRRRPIPTCAQFPFGGHAD